MNLTLVELLVLLLIAGIAGVIAEWIVGFSPGGFLVSIVVGVLGAFIGTWLARQFGLPEFFALQIGGQSFPIVWSILGSILLLAVLSVARRPRRSYRRAPSRRRYYR
jgi:uncharacterized membrane protein YeaQ/YmgE (transglycosylase-associated protein family)